MGKRLGLSCSEFDQIGDDFIVVACMAPHVAPTMSTSNHWILT